MSFSQEVIAIIVALQLHETLNWLWRVLNPRITTWTSESDVYVVNNHASAGAHQVLQENMKARMAVARTMDTASILAACRKKK